MTQQKPTDAHCECAPDEACPSGIQWMCNRKEKTTDAEAALALSIALQKAYSDDLGILDISDKCVTELRAQGFEIVRVK